MIIYLLMKVIQNLLMPVLNWIISKGTVSAGDLDGDNDLDLFIGGRQIPGKCVLKSESAILINENGFFKDRTDAGFLK
jgi:hypothetical protein